MLNIQLDDVDFDIINIIDENGEKNTYSLREELAINEMNIPNEYLQQSSKYIYWTAILEKIRLYQESTSIKLDLVKAKCYISCREEWIKQGVTKPTKDQLEASIVLKPEYQEVVNDLNYYTYLVKQLQYVVKSFEQRKDMLIQYGAELRKQKAYMGNPNV